MPAFIYAAASIMLTGLSVILLAGITGLFFLDVAVMKGPISDWVAIVCEPITHLFFLAIWAVFLAGSTVAYFGARIKKEDFAAGWRRIMELAGTAMAAAAVCCALSLAFFTAMIIRECRTEKNGYGPCELE